MLTAVENHPCKLFQIDEFGMFLAGVTGKRAPSHKAEIWAELTKLYSRAKGVYRGTEYANRRENPRVDVIQPCVCVYGTTTPSTFWEALEGGAMADGSLARFLVFVSDDNRPARNLHPVAYSTPPEIIEALQSIAAGPGYVAPAKGGNMPGGAFVPPMSATDRPDPYVVAMDHAATHLHLEKLAFEDAWAVQVAETPMAPIVNRLAENAIKLALVSSISNRPGSPIIERHDIAWGWALAEHCTRTLMADATRFIANNDYERKLNKLVDIITKHGPVTEFQIHSRYSFKVPPRERAEMLNDLTKLGILAQIAPEAGKSGPKTIRYIIEAQETSEADNS